MFPNAKIAGSRNTVLLHAESKGQSMLNVIDHTRVNTIIISLSTAKQISRLTLLDSKQNKGNYTPILSNVQTTKATTGRLQLMSILETLVQQKIAYKEIPRNL